MRIIDKFEVQGSTAGYTDGALELRLVVDGGNLAQRVEEALGSVTGFTGTLIPWPLDPAAMIDYWHSNPWLAAIGKILAETMASAEYDLEPRAFRTDGTQLGKKTGETSHDQQQYATSMAWLSREDLAQDGVSLYGLPQFMQAAALHIEQTGNVFLEVMRDLGGRGPQRLGLMLPQYLTYIFDKDRPPKLFQLDPYSGRRWFESYGTRARANDGREFIHLRLPNTLSNVYGLPPWIEARDSVEVDNAHRKYLKGFFKNHGAPRWVIEITQDAAWQGPPPDTTARETLYTYIKSYLDANRGEMAGRNLLLQYPGGILIKVTPLDYKLEDPTFIETARNARDEILAVRHISLLNLGLPEGGYRATAENQSDNFERQVLQPFATPLLSAINRILTAKPPYGLGITDYRLVAEFRDVDIVQQRIEAVVKAAGRPVLTGDEGRELLGYEPRGDNQVLIPANLIPAEGAGSQIDQSPDTEINEEPGGTE